MKNESDKSEQAKKLRDKAEELIKKKFPHPKEKAADIDVHHAIQELEIHQVELELQNEELILAKAASDEIAEKYKELYDFAPSGYITFSKDGKIKNLNLTASVMLGKERAKLINTDIIAFISEDTKPIFRLFLNNVFKHNDKRLCEARLVNSSNHHTEIYMTGITNEDGNECNISMVDISERKQMENINLARLRLFAFAKDHTLDELLEQTLNEAEEITGSRIAFFHFLEADQKTLLLQEWSTRTKKEFCKAEGKGRHYDLDMAGVWADCIIERKTIVHNDYIGLINKKGLPPGHAMINRELVVPVMRNGKITAILGVGNKPTDYKNHDIESITLFADLAWDIAEKKIADEKLKQSENKFRITFDQSPVGAALVSLDRKFIKCNESFCDFLGYEEKELIGKTISDITYPEDEEAGNVLIKQLLSGNIETFTLEKRFLRKSGRIVWGEVTASLVKDVNNKPLFILPAILDINERKLSVEKLQKSEHYLQEAQSLAMLGTYVVDITTGKWESSELLDNIFGINPDFNKSVEGWLSIIHPDMQEEIKNYFTNEVFGKKQRFDKEYKIIRSLDNTERWVHGTGKMQFNDSNEAIGLIGTIQDITERKRNELELINAKEKAEESDRLKTAFLCNVSHEIRTPMNSIIGFSNLLKKPELSEKSKEEYCDIIELNSNNLLNIIEDILAISKIESGLFTLKPEEVNINKFVSQLYEEVRLKNKNKLIEIILNPETSKKNIILKTDEHRLRQVLNNLISNAQKFTKQGSVEIGYEIIHNQKYKSDKSDKSEQSEESIKFYVKDTGIGISKEYNDIIFERFRQLEETSTRHYGGTGLGLAISKKIVKAMGGDIWVESEAGKGSKFIFTLPYESENKQVVPAKNKTNINIPDLKNKKILIVEDDDFNYHFFTILLKKTKADFIRATDANECIEIFKQDKDIDLVMMDIQLPGMNGFEATKILKKIRKNVPVIAQTAYAMSSDIDQCLEAGCNDVITKPINVNTLWNLLEKHLTK